MKNVILSLVAIVISLFVGLLGTYVILSVSNLYSLNFISELGFLKLFGLMAILNLVLYKHSDEIEGDEDEKIKEIFTRIFGKLILYLAFWGLSFLMFYILK